jgi:hypothetical protein
MNEPAQAPQAPTTGPSGFFKFRPVHVDLGDVLVQILAVALGVILGFAVTAWTEQVRQRSLLRETVGNIVTELRSNQDGMRQVTAQHARSAAQLAAFSKRSKHAQTVSLNDAETVLAPHSFPVNIPLGIAWQIAQNDQGLTLLPYEDRYDLAWIYQVQIVYYEAEQRYENSLLTVAEPRDGNYYIEIVDLANQVQAVVGIERKLDDLYTNAIKRAAHEFAL